MKLSLRLLRYICIYLSNLNNQRIIVITHRERNEKTGRMENIISHGVLEDTSKNVILKNSPLSKAKALG